MNWLVNYVKPTLSKMLNKRDNVPENSWIKCPDTEKMIHRRELISNNYVSPYSNHHFRMPIKSRLEMLFDDGKYETFDVDSVKDDPLEFKDTKKYTDRLKDSRKKTGAKDGIIVAFGTIGGKNAVISAFDFSFMGGSMGCAVGEGIVLGSELALEKKAAFITIPASGGARMQEGILSLMQMARSTVGVRRVKKSGLPYIVVLTDPTTGGVSASFAMIGDVHIAEQKCMIGFAGPRVIEQTVREKLPEGFQTAEYLNEHGMVDIVVHRKNLKDTLAKYIGLVLNKNC